MNRSSLLLLDGHVEVILAPDDDLAPLARRRRRLQHDARRLLVQRLQLLRLPGQRGREATEAPVDVSVRCGGRKAVLLITSIQSVHQSLQE